MLEQQERKRSSILGNYFMLNLNYVDMTGDIIAGMLLSQIVEYMRPDRNLSHIQRMIEGRLWLVLRREDWYPLCRITPKQFDRASNLLVQQDIIAKRVLKFNDNTTIHITLKI